MKRATKERVAKRREKPLVQAVKNLTSMQTWANRFYPRDKIFVQCLPVTLLGNSHGRVNRSLSLSRNKEIKSKLFNEISQQLGML